MTFAERLRWLRTKTRRVLFRRHEEAAMDAEMRFHFEQLVAEFRAEGMSERAACLAAHREFGTVDAYREEVRDTWRPPSLAEAWRSLAFATRSLLRTPGFTALAVLTLGLGIGANTSMFSVFSGVALNPLPYQQPEQLDRVFRRSAENPKGAFAAADFLEFQRASRDVYAGVAGMASREASLAAPGEPAEFTDLMRVSTNFFTLVGIPPALGRDFRPEEEQFGGPDVAIISHRLWQTRFGGRPDIIGHEIRLDGVVHTVIGVLPETFSDWRHLGWVDVFRPLALSPDERAATGSFFVEPIARRADGVSTTDAAAFVQQWGKQLSIDAPGVHAETTCYRLALDEHVTGPDSKIVLMMLLGLSGFVVLIACSNLANFLLARTMARAREFAVRAALGASRRQLLRPLVVESLILAVAGGLLALLVAVGFTDWMRLRSTDDSGDQVRFVVDWSIMMWALLCSVGTALAFGIAPALFALRLDLNHTLKSGGRGATGGKGHQLLRHLLIVGQFALAMVLLTGSALFINGLDELNARRAGWDSRGLLTGTFLLPEAHYNSPAEIRDFQNLAIDSLAALPGVEAVALAAAPPFFPWTNTQRLLVEGQERPPAGREPAALRNVVTPAYFSTVGTRLLAGRHFDATDTADAPPTVIINAAMAEALFGTADPIGRRVAAASDSNLQWAQIVGVVQDVRNVMPEATTLWHQIYLPMAQQPSAYNELAVRTSGDPSALAAAVRQTIATLDPDLPVRNLKSADDRVSRANYQLGVLRDMLTGFALLGLTLAAIGIYGVIARTMAQRHHEFGIRLALGAQARDIVRLVLGTGTRLTATGAALGLIGGWGLSRLLASGFPNMDIDNPWIVILATAILMIVALLACYLPAHRAGRINPVDSLRAE